MHVQFNIFLGTFLLLAQLSFGSAKDSNVVIKEGREMHEFIGNKANGTVQVKQLISKTYTCNYFATTLPIIESYHDQVSIDDVDFTFTKTKSGKVKPRYSSYDVDGVFFSDHRICFFELPLEEKGSSGTVSFRKTISDPRYFCSIFFSDSYTVISKEVSLKIPRWMKVDLKEMNFDDFEITKTASYSKPDDADIYTYTIRNIPVITSEVNSPGFSYIEPHILVLAKEANLHNSQQVYIGTVADQYAWYRQLVRSIGSNDSIVKARALQLTAGKTNDLEKIKAVFYWVQNNIRYVAFENGIAAFKPDKADEVIRKKYGDCKGVANLTKQLLISLGYDARLCWLGTRDIAYDYSTPSIAVDNHMICALSWQGNMYFLDATQSYLALNEYAERIQGRQCLIEDGDKYLITNIRSSTPEQNLDEEKRVLAIQGSDLKGTVFRQWKGEAKEYVLMGWNSTAKDKSSSSFVKYLSAKNPDYLVVDLKTSDINNYDKDFSATYSLSYKNAVSSFTGEYYLALDFGREFSNFTIDSSKRRLDYWFNRKMQISRQSALFIPADYQLRSMPPDLEIKNDNYEFRVKHTLIADTIFYRKLLVIKDTKLQRSMFTQWNKDIEKLTASYNEQIVLTAK